MAYLILIPNIQYLLIFVNIRSKADFSQQVNKSMKSTIHKWVVNVIPVTNPTQYTKLAK